MVKLRKKKWSQKLELVMNSIQRSKNNEDFPKIFYRNLFFMNSKIEKYFINTNWEHQEKAFLHAIDNMTHFLEDNSGFSRNQVSRLAQLHSKKNLNIHPHEYYYWIEALILALKEADPHWIESYQYYVREVFFYPISFMISMYLI